MTRAAYEPVLIAGVQVNYAQLALAAGLLMVLLVVGYIGVSMLRRWLRRGLADRTAMPFSLADLRTMHREGQLSDEEFNRAREQILARFGAGGSTRTPGATTRENLPPGDGTSLS